MARSAEKKLNSQAAQLLKAELKFRSISYGMLARQMSSNGFEVTEPAIRSRLSRGSLSAAFVLGALQAMSMTGPETGDFVARLWKAGGGAKR